jgi:outer membrane protein assembly factor BamB
VSGTTVVAVGASTVLAADLTTGRQLWRVARAYGPPEPAAIAETPKGELLLYTEGFGPTQPGTCGSNSSSPTPSASTSPVMPAPVSDLTAVDLATHRPAWTAPVSLPRVSRTGVTVDGETAFVGARRTIYAVDASTGKLRWTALAGGFLTTTLAVSDGVVVATVQGSGTTPAHLIAFKESDGTQAWEQELKGVGFASSPAIGAGRVIVGLSDQTVQAFDLTSGTPRWSARINAPVFFMTAPAVGPDAVVVEDILGTVYALDPATGARRWAFALNEPAIRTPPVLVGDRVLASTERGSLAAIDLSSGRLVWRGTAGGDPLRNLAPTGDAIVAVAGGASPGLVAFFHDPNGTLVSVVSPTVPKIPVILGAFLAAAVPLALLLLLAGRALLARMGPAFLPDDDGRAIVPDGDEGADG